MESLIQCLAAFIGCFGFTFIFRIQKNIRFSIIGSLIGTLGWFDCFTIDRQNGDDMLIISMVENTQNNSDGGSHYLIQKIRTLF